MSIFLYNLTWLRNSWNFDAEFNAAPVLSEKRPKPDARWGGILQYRLV
jgi:hypothetical protein